MERRLGLGCPPEMGWGCQGLETGCLGKRWVMGWPGCWQVAREPSQQSPSAGCRHPLADSTPLSLGVLRLVSRIWVADLGWGCHLPVSCAECAI